MGNLNISVRQMSEMPEDDYICIDTRGQTAYQHGHIPGAVCLEDNDGSLKKFSRDKKLIVYCTYGEKSIVTTEKLIQEGYDAYNLTGGYRAWLLQRFEELDAEEVRRYDRQMIHNMETEYMNKAESAKLSLKKLNDRIEIKAYPYALTADNAEEIIGKYDFIIDAADNFETKFLINDACVLLGKAFCHAGILQFTGQVMTYVPGDNPCYRCVFEEIPEKGSVPNCSEAGILGAVAGIIGSIQALETVKYLLGVGELLTGKIFVLDGLSMTVRIVRFNGKNEDCKVCGSHRTITNIRETITNIRENVVGKCGRL